MNETSGDGYLVKRYNGGLYKKRKGKKRPCLRASRHEGKIYIFYACYNNEAF